MNSIKNVMPHNYHYGATVHPASIEPVSRTYQYRKVMKPMLERKRRARINKCLDELKDLLSSTLNTDCEHVSKLEKADILEMTVRHLQQLRENKSLFLNNSNSLNTQKFWDGFQRCTAEVQQFIHKHNQNVSCELVRYFSTLSTSKENCQKYHSVFSVMQAHEFALARKHTQSNIKCIENCSNPITPTISIEDYNVWRPW